MSSIEGGLRPGDAILAINGIDCRTVTHGSCVDILRNAGEKVILLIGRRVEGASAIKDELDGICQPNGNMTSSNSTLDDSLDIHHIRLVKNKSGLGFSIAGGVGNEHVEGNDGIFVTKIIGGGAAFMDGRLQAGDRIISVDEQPLCRVTHEQAVYRLTQTGHVVNLKVARDKLPCVESSDERVHQSDSSSSAGSLAENAAKSQANILEVSHVSELGVPEGSAAASALQSGCELYDAADDQSHHIRTGKFHRKENLVKEVSIFFVQNRSKYFVGNLF